MAEGLHRPVDVTVEEEAPKTPGYADVLTELKRRTFGDTELLSAPLAPMHTGLQRQQQHLLEQMTGKRTAVKSPQARAMSPSAIHEKAQQSLDESTKRLKAIEDHMWQYRQEERDLKRMEMDLMRQKKNMQKSLKQYESKMARQQSEEVRSLLEKETQYNQYVHKQQHMKEENTKNKIQEKMVGRRKLNEQTKNYIKNSNEMSFKYMNLMDIIDQKRHEMEELSKQFEVRLREKAHEQFKLEQELAAITISLNMEAQKKRQQVVESKKQRTLASLKDIQANQGHDEALQTEDTHRYTAAIKHEQQQRKLEQSVLNKQDTVATRQRQDSRKLADVKTQLQQTSESQRYTKKEAEHIKLNILNEKTSERVDIATSKRRQQMNDVQQRVKERNYKKLKDWADRAVSMENEARRREHEDRLKLLSKRVSHQDTIEHSLYSKARELDSFRKKQSQVVDKLQQDLDSLKRENAIALKQTAVKAQKAEQDLQQKILREEAELAKYINTREECIRSLQAHRSHTREDRRLLDEERKEHSRRTRIAERSQLKTSVTI